MSGIYVLWIRAPGIIERSIGTYILPPWMSTASAASAAFRHFYRAAGYQGNPQITNMRIRYPHDSIASTEMPDIEPYITIRHMIDQNGTGQHYMMIVNVMASTVDAE